MNKNDIILNDNILNDNNNKNKNNLYKNINKLPIVLIDYIKDYIPYTTLAFVNKEFYIKYHYLLKINNLIPKKYIENYIRDIIRRDFDFVFEKIISENYKKWLDIKQFIYKNIIYKNYIYFLKDFCLINESIKCRIILNNFLEENGLCKNQHKKNTSKHIRWK